MRAFCLNSYCGKRKPRETKASGVSELYKLNIYAVYFAILRTEYKTLDKWVKSEELASVWISMCLMRIAARSKTPNVSICTFHTAAAPVVAVVWDAIWKRRGKWRNEGDSFTCCSSELYNTPVAFIITRNKCSLHIFKIIVKLECSKSSFFVQKFNFDFPWKLSIFGG